MSSATQHSGSRSTKIKLRFRSAKAWSESDRKTLLGCMWPGPVAMITGAVPMLMFRRADTVAGDAELMLGVEE